MKSIEFCGRTDQMDGQLNNFAFKFLFAIETGMNSGSYVPLDLVDFTFFSLNCFSR